MHQDISVVVQARSLLVERLGDIAWQSAFLSLGADLQVIGPAQWTRQDIAHFQARQWMLVNDITSIITLLERLNLMRALAQGEGAWRDRWRSYAAVDIEAFHIYVRSIMDYAEGLLVAFADKPGQIGRAFDWGSFHARLNWLGKNPGNAGRLGADLTALVLNAGPWFSDLCDVRDEIAHRGALTLAFGEPEDGILFQVHDARLRRLVSQNGLVMKDANVAYFDRYAALYLAHVLVFLEDLTDVIYSKLSLQRADNPTWALHSGWSVVVQWMDSLIALV